MHGHGCSLPDDEAVFHQTGSFLGLNTRPNFGERHFSTVSAAGFACPRKTGPEFSDCSARSSGRQSLPNN